MKNTDPSIDVDYSKCLSFLYAAISDTQAVIRAIDTKSSGVLIIFSLAFSKLHVIFSVGVKLFDYFIPYLSIPMLLLFILSWLVGMYAALMTLIAIDDPRRHINGSAGKGAFYSGGLYQTKLIDSFENRSTLVSKLTWDAHQARLPLSDKEIFEELSFEQMKLVYIRSLKLRRVQTAYIAAILWIASGGLIWLLVLSTGV